MKTQILPYIGIVLSASTMLYIQIKESIQYWIFKNKRSEENIKFDFTKSSLEVSVCFNILLICVIWAIYNDFVR